MTDLLHAGNQIQCVSNFHDLVSAPFNEVVNAICWNRKLTGDFSEIVRKIEPTGNVTEIDQEQLLALKLSEQGQLARDVLVSDWKLLEAHGALPMLNLISHYDRDDACSFFPTDVYSFHVDRSPVPGATFLCTYYGQASEILSNSGAKQKILIPEIRDELRKIYHGGDEGFEIFLAENFFDLHYQPEPGANPISLGIGHLWRLAVDHPGSKTPPCVHRAPKEKPGESRLLMIC